jgi:hypothetical protein
LISKSADSKITAAVDDFRSNLTSNDISAHGNSCAVASTTRTGAAAGVDATGKGATLVD